MQPEHEGHSKGRLSGWRTVLDVSAGLLSLIAAAILIAVGVVVLKVVASKSSTAIDAVPVEPILIAGAAIEGRSDAPVVLIEFSDFQCPACRRFDAAVLRDLRERYVAKGKVALAFLHFPLTQKHPAAFRAAVAAECAGAQGRFWSIHEYLFQSPENLEDAAVTSWLKRTGIDMSKFQACSETGGPERVRQQMVSARALGVGGTPTVLVGLNRGSDRVLIKTRFRGVPTLAAVTEAVDSLGRSQ